MAKKSPTDSYGADSIKVLEGLEAVRKRPGMYIGDTSARGLHHLVTEIVDNSVDEALAGFCTEINVVILGDDRISVEDNGRGIPVDMHPTEKRSALEVVHTVLHAGGKFEKSAYKVSGGLHGVGASVVNALSDEFEVEVHKNGKIYFQRYERGIPKTKVEERGKTDSKGTKTTFTPDSKIFPEIKFKYEINLGKDLRVGREGGLGALAVGLAALFDLGFRNPALVALEVNFAVLVNFDLELVTERVDDRRTHTMQSAGDFVRALLELAAGVKHRVHDFECRALFSGMHIDRNSAAVVLDRNPIVAQNHDVDFRAVTGQRFVDRVVHDLIAEMMQPAFGGVADVHPGPFANRFETFEYLDGLGAIAVGRLFICHRKERAMDYLSASPPPAKIVFVCGRKVKKNRAVQSDNQTLFESTACG